MQIVNKERWQLHQQQTTAITINTCIIISQQQMHNHINIIIKSTMTTATITRHIMVMIFQWLSMSTCDCCRIYEWLNWINAVTNSDSLLQNVEFFCVISQQFDLSSIYWQFLGPKLVLHWHQVVEHAKLSESWTEVGCWLAQNKRNVTRFYQLSMIYQHAVNNDQTWCQCRTNFGPRCWSWISPMMLSLKYCCHLFSAHKLRLVYL